MKRWGIPAGVAGIAVSLLFAVAGSCRLSSGGTRAGPGQKGAPQTADRLTARQILQAAGVTGGLIVHLHCGDGRLTAALHAGPHYLVHGLDTDADRVRRARQLIQGSGRYGQVSVDRFDGKHLPYVDNLVNLIVAERLGGVPVEEAMRVLAPGGTLYCKRDGRWQATVKPSPGTIDEWTHYLHDAGGNAVAHDELVGPPRRLQWTAGPRHARSHEHTPTIMAMVSCAGRVFYIADEGPTFSIRQPAQWHLVARDAFNGVLLWSRPLQSWYPHIVNWGSMPRQLERRLVAVGNRVYATLGYFAPVSALEAEAGEVVRVYEGTEGTEEIVCHRGVLLLAVRAVTEQRRSQRARWARLERADKSPLFARETAEPLLKEFRSAESAAPRSVLAVDAETGRVLWKTGGGEARRLRALTLCAAGPRAFYQVGGQVVCRALRSGRRLWSVPATGLRLVASGLVICAGRQKVTALSAETGQPLWSQRPLLTDIRDAFVAGGSLWLGGFKPYPAKRGPAWGPYFATQRELTTGKVLKHIEPPNPGHHHRCYLNKATDRYILGGRRGVEFIDLKTGEVRWHSWVRGVCRYGIMPCNGLLYAPPHACGCYIAAKLTGFYALASGNEEASPAVGQRSLERGPAYAGPPPAAAAAAAAPSAQDWPAYRHDAQRSGATGAAVPPRLRPKWQADVGQGLTSITVADGKLFVAVRDEHLLVAIDADTGRPAWRFTAGARIDSPPTIHGGRALFGSRDGFVYSVRTSDGELAWRLQAARQDRRTVAGGQLESVWPTPGSVLTDGGVAYLTAGRSSYLDGGIDLLRIRADTGQVLSSTTIYSPDPQTGKQPAQQGPAYMPGSLADILSADASCVYLRDAAFTKTGQRAATPRPHLFTLTGFLDDTWPHRSYWIFGTRCSLATGCSGRDRKLVYGRLLVFDHSTVFGYGRAAVHWSNQLQDAAYRLFAVKRGPIKGPQKRPRPLWQKPLPIAVRAMVKAADTLFVAGPELQRWLQGPGSEPAPRAMLIAVAANDGTELARYSLPSPPVFDGMAAARRRLYLALENGQVVCLGGASSGQHRPPGR